MKKGLLAFILILSFSASLSFVAASHEACYNQGNASQNKSNRSNYDIFINPTTISSENASGSKLLGCATSTFGGSCIDAEPLKENGLPLTREEILREFARLVDIRNNSSGTFDQNLEILIRLLRRDPRNNYTVTIKRVRDHSSPPVRDLPNPRIIKRGNVEIKIYRPYNFGPSDIADAMSVTPTVGIGAVAYVGNREIFAHMIRPLGINLRPNRFGRYEFLIYDPYFGSETPTILEIIDGKTYTNFWNARVHLEELFYIEKRTNRTPPGGGGGGGNGGGSHIGIGKIGNYIPIGDGMPIKKVLTPMCGDGKIDKKMGEECDNGKDNGPSKDCTSLCKLNVCGDGFKHEKKEECDNGKDNGPSKDCTPKCTLNVCGDGFKHKKEACDDGNKDNTDDCNDKCKLTFCGDGIVNGLSRVEECDDGNNKDGDGCSSQCKIERIKIIGCLGIIDIPLDILKIVPKSKLECF